MAKMGRPPVAHPRGHGVFVRFSDTEWGSMVEARAREHSVAARRPSLAEWIRDLMVAHASAVLEVEVELTRFRGHLILWEKGGHDAEDPCTLST